MGKYEQFKRFQKIILFIANNRLGRFLLGVSHEVPSSQKILRIFPNSYIVKEQDNYVQTFRTYDLFALKLEKLLKILVMVSTPLIVPLPKIAPLFLPFLTTRSFFAGGGDGRVARTGQGSWAAAHDNTDGTAADITATGNQVICQPSADGGWRIDRLFFPFDTSAIPDGAVITQGLVNIKCANLANHFIDLPIHLILTTQASNTALVVGDFDQVGTTDQAPAINSSTFVVGNYVTWILNATGRSNVSLTGFTKFGLRTDHDFTNTQCTDAANNTTAPTFSMSETLGTDSDPYLRLTYPGGGASLFLDSFV